MQQPDFSSPVFMRWDLPGFLSIENNLLFPRSFDSYVEIANLTADPKTNLSLKLTSSDALTSNITEYSINVPAMDVAYRPIHIKSSERYEDKIVELSISVERSGQLLDSIFRQVYLPAVPVSDTGLVCTIDTVIASAYPQIQFTFEAQVEATGQKIFSLSPENIFLYENENRVPNFSMGKDTTGGVMAADIVFVLDVTGSMGNEIAKVRDNIIEFCDSLEARGIDFRLGMVTFLDVIENIYNFTADPQRFKNNVAAQYAHGGGDGPENSLDALYRATQFTFRPSAKRIFIWITDANYHEQDHVTARNKQEVVNQLLLYDVTVHAIGSQMYQTAWYNPIIEPTGGSYYSIAGNFRDILLDITRMKTASRYLISYNSPGAMPGINNIKLEIHYAGLGGFGYAEYNYGGMVALAKKSLACYPNPFNPTVQISVDMPKNGQGTVEIFNILGQRVRSFSLDGFDKNKKVILWDAKDSYNHEVNVGTYFVRLKVFGKDNKLVRHETAKILYLK